MISKEIIKPLLHTIFIVTGVIALVEGVVDDLILRTILGFFIIFMGEVIR